MDYSSTGVPGTPAALHPSTASPNDLILYYSLAGFRTYCIHRFLSNIHGMHISKRHIRRIRSRLGVSSTSQASIPSVCAAIQVSKDSHCWISALTVYYHKRSMILLMFITDRRNCRGQAPSLDTGACGVDCVLLINYQLQGTVILSMCSCIILIILLLF